MSHALRAGEVRRLSIDDYRDKMAGGWIGQMAGVGWGGPTEFKWKGAIIPADQMPKWQPKMVNQFHQDDLYVEMTFLRTLELHGWDVSIRQAGIDFANSGYPLWHANRAGRDNLRSGIAPPDSGHPQFNQHADDIDYQIEADFSGLIAPGMPNVPIQLGEIFGRLMNYGDGLYGGQFVGGMYAGAFFEKDPLKLVEAGLKCIPAGSQYAECIRDVIRWWRQYPDDWTRTWDRINRKYHLNPRYRRFSCSGPEGAFNIDAKLNGAYIVVGLLYGGGNMDRTIQIATRCGQDSDCNPANAAGVLGTALGRQGLDPKYTSAIDPNGVFSHTAYTFPALIAVSEKLVRQAVIRSGGHIEKDARGREVLVIPVIEPRPGKLEQCWAPGPIAHSRFTEAELEQITAGSVDRKVQTEFQKRFPGWTIAKCGPDMEPGLRPKYRGRSNVFMTHPLNREVGCVLSRKVDVPGGKQTTLRLVVAADERGDWTLIAKANGRRLVKQRIAPQTTSDGWVEVKLDLTPWAGKSVKLELINQADGWSYEAAYWAEIALNGARSFVPGDAASGPLRVFPDNPRYFTDGSGRAIYLTGSHTWNSLVDMGPGDPPARFDFAAYLRWMGRYPHNFIRLWTWELTRWDTSANRERAAQVHHAAPSAWARTGPGKALDGKPRFDLKQFDPEYFDRLRQRVAAAQKQGIYVSVMLFEGWGLQRVAGSWKTHPFHPRNNINGIDGDVNGDGVGVEVHELVNPAVTAIQEAYVRKVIDTVNAFDNVLYEISNENHPASTPWQYHMIRFIKAYEKRLPKQHPVGMTFQFKGGKNQTLFDSPADWISPNPEGGYRDQPPAADGSKVILTDTDHLWGIGGNPDWVWRSFLRGLNPIFMDPYRGKVLRRGFSEQQCEAIRQAMGYTLQWARRVPLRAMLPKPALASTGFCLAPASSSGAGAWLVYLPVGGEVKVDLSGHAGNWSVEWFNAVSGKTQSGKPVKGGGERRLRSPWSERTLLHLSKS